MSRNWYQIRLTTCIVLMFVTGMFVGLNLIVKRVDTISTHIIGNLDKDTQARLQITSTYTYGLLMPIGTYVIKSEDSRKAYLLLLLPLRLLESNETPLLDVATTFPEVVVLNVEFQEQVNHGTFAKLGMTEKIYYSGLVVNLIVIFSVLGLTAYVAEGILLRKELRKSFTKT